MPSRFDSAAQSWSRRAMLTVHPVRLRWSPVALALVTSGDENSSRISVGKL